MTPARDVFAETLGTVRMVVESVTPDRGSRHKIRAYSKMTDSKAPFVSLSVTIQIECGVNQPCYEGDEFELKFDRPAWAER